MRIEIRLPKAAISGLSTVGHYRHPREYRVGDTNARAGERRSTITVLTRRYHGGSWLFGGRRADGHGWETFAPTEFVELADSGRFEVAPRRGANGVMSTLGRVTGTAIGGRSHPWPRARLTVFGRSSAGTSARSS